MIKQIKYGPSTISILKILSWTSGLTCLQISIYLYAIRHIYSPRNGIVILFIFYWTNLSTNKNNSYYMPKLDSFNLYMWKFCCKPNFVFLWNFINTNSLNKKPVDVSVQLLVLNESSTTDILTIHKGKE